MFLFSFSFIFSPWEFLISSIFFFNGLGLDLIFKFFLDFYINSYFYFLYFSYAAFFSAYFFSWIYLAALDSYCLFFSKSSCYFFFYCNFNSYYFFFWSYFLSWYSWTFCFSYWSYFSFFFFSSSILCYYFDFSWRRTCSFCCLSCLFFSKIFLSYWSLFSLLSWIYYWAFFLSAYICWKVYLNLVIDFLPSATASTISDKLKATSRAIYLSYPDSLNNSFLTFKVKYFSLKLSLFYSFFLDSNDLAYVLVVTSENGSKMWNPILSNIISSKIFKTSVYEELKASSEMLWKYSTFFSTTFLYP